MSEQTKAEIKLIIGLALYTIGVAVTVYFIFATW